VATVVVPFRSGGKSRLPPAFRVDLALAMVGDVLEAATAFSEHVRLVTDDSDARLTAGKLGVDLVVDPGGGQGAAINAALARLEGSALVINADLPCASPEALTRLAALGPSYVPAPDGTTNALSLPDPGRFVSLYGPGSAARFAMAGFADAAIPELEQDVDTLADIERLTLPIGARTRLVLNQHRLSLASVS
jgi:2-phospho-L-lactate guanylyltransferase (CobY/MobA/RfbA family)